MEEKEKYRLTTNLYETVVIMQVADFVLARLREWGVHRVYGYPGDGINGFLGAYDRAGACRTRWLAGPSWACPG